MSSPQYVTLLLDSDKVLGPQGTLPHCEQMTEGREVTYLVLVNSKSGGQDGPKLLEKFREMASQPPPRGLKGEVVSLTDPRPDGTGVLGPRPGLERFKGTRNLRVIGRICFKDNIENV